MIRNTFRFVFALTTLVQISMQQDASAASLPLRVTVEGQLYAFGRTPAVGVLGEKIEITTTLHPEDFDLLLFENSQRATRSFTLIPVREVPFEIKGSVTGLFERPPIVSDINVTQVIGLGQFGRFNQLQFRDYISNVAVTTLIWMNPRGTNTTAQSGFPPRTVDDFLTLFEKILNDQTNWRHSNSLPQFVAGRGQVTDVLALQNYGWTVVRVPEQSSLMMSIGCVGLASIGWIRIHGLPKI